MRKLLPALNQEKKPSTWQLWEKILISFDFEGFFCRPSQQLVTQIWYWQNASNYCNFLSWVRVHCQKRSYKKCYCFKNLTFTLCLQPAPLFKVRLRLWCFCVNFENVFQVFSFFHFFSPLMYNHTTSSQLYYKYLQNLQRLHAKYAQSSKTTALNLRNTARKTLEKNAM